MKRGLVFNDVYKVKKQHKNSHGNPNSICLKSKKRRLDVLFSALQVNELSKVIKVNPKPSLESVSLNPIQDIKTNLDESTTTNFELHKVEIKEPKENDKEPKEVVKEPKEVVKEPKETILSFMQNKSFKSKRFDYYHSLKLLQGFLSNATNELLSKCDNQWDNFIKPIDLYLKSNIQNEVELKKWLIDLEIAEAAACAIKEESEKWESEITTLRLQAEEVLAELKNIHSNKNTTYFT